jgi:flagellin-like protein
MKKSRRNRGLSPVIATIILSAVVISIGGAVWSYAQGAATVNANQYVDTTMELMNEIIERFSIEHVSNNSDGNTLYVWVYNHGDVDIIVDLYANSTGVYLYTFETTVVSEDLVKVSIDFQSDPLVAGDEVAIKAHSRRQNNAYYTYYVH